MGRGARVTVLAIPAALGLALAGCKKGGPMAPDAAVEDASAAVDLDAAPAMTASAAPPSSAPRIVSLAEALPAPPAHTSWSGFYKCKVRLNVSHSDGAVSGRMTSEGETTIFACTLAGDICTGTETTTRQTKGKAVPPRTRKVTLRRGPTGTLLYHPEGAPVQSCPKL